MTEEEIEKVESIVNFKIRENIKLEELRNVPIEQAKNMGATALFGEKYGDFVRVIIFDKKYSIELCGGTHVPATGQIGFLKITAESSVAAGVRRIEAITAEHAEAYVRDQDKLMQEVKELLKNPKDLAKAVKSIIEEKNQLGKELEILVAEKANSAKIELIKLIKKHGDINLLVAQVQVPTADSLKKISFELKNEVANLLMVLVAEIDQKPQISIILSDNVIANQNLHAGNLVRELAKEIKGGGGGQPFYATAGGNDLNGMANVIKRTYEIIGIKG